MKYRYLFYRHCSKIYIVLVDENNLIYNFKIFNWAVYERLPSKSENLPFRSIMERPTMSRA